MTIPSDTTEAAADLDIGVDAYTEWGEVFDALTTTEQECIRDTLGSDLLESVLERSVMAAWEAPEAGEMLVYSCLTPQTARAVFLSTIIAAMGEDAAFEIDTDGEACLAEWVAGLEVVLTLAALSVYPAEVERDIVTAFMACNPGNPGNSDLVVSAMLEETGLTVEDLTEEEATCLRSRAADTDWTDLFTGSTYDPSMLRDFILNLLECAPNLVISAMLEEYSLTLEDVTEEEATCLEARAATTDWTTLFADATEDPSLLFEVIGGLFDCVPDLSGSEPGDSHWDEVIEEATGVEIGTAIQGELEYDGDRGHFTFEATEGGLYELDVHLETLQDSVLAIFNAYEDYAIAHNDNYGDSMASRLIWEAPRTGTYYIEVASPDDGTGTYTLTITTADDDPDIAYDHSDIADDHPNSAANATPVEIGAATQGELEYDRDSDFFTFEATRGQAYELDVTLGTLHPSRLAIYDGLSKYDTDLTSAAIASYHDYGDPTAPGLIWHAPDTGTYYVEITSFDIGTGTYTLAITISDIKDDHPNSPANAAPVEIGAATQGELEYDNDFDFFAFEATEGEYYQLAVTLGTLHDSRLTIYDGDGFGRARNNNYGDSTAAPLIWRAPDTDTYYVQVASFPTLTGTYTLTIIIPDIKDDHANWTTNATPVELDVATQGELEYDNDSDSFAFEATEGQAYELDVTLGTLPVSALDLYGADGKLTSYDDHGDSTSRLIWHAPDTGTYYAVINSFGTVTGTYTLTITLSDIEDDHPNSTANATPVEIGIATQGELEHDHDRDVFSFEATGGEYYELNVTLGTLQDSALRIYDTDGTGPIANSGDSTTSPIVWRAPDTGTYYVLVHSFASGTGTYTLTIILSDIEDDHPNSTANATPVEIGIATQGELESVNDRDVFTFEATTGELYELNVALGTLQDAALTLFDADGTWLDFNDYRDSPASPLIWQAPATGTYHVKVQSYRRSTGTYTLTIAPS